MMEERQDYSTNCLLQGHETDDSMKFITGEFESESGIWWALQEAFYKGFITGEIFDELRSRRISTKKS